MPRNYQTVSLFTRHKGDGRRQFEETTIMIDPPSHTPSASFERKVELDQAVDYAVQMLVEEAHLVGWTRVEFLTAILDASNDRLSAIEEERELEEGST
jgi:hypothetical protein